MAKLYYPGWPLQPLITEAKVASEGYFFWMVGNQRSPMSSTEAKAKHLVIARDSMGRKPNSRKILFTLDNLGRWDEGGERGELEEILLPWPWRQERILGLRRRTVPVCPTSMLTLVRSYKAWTAFAHLSKLLWHYGQNLCGRVKSEQATVQLYSSQSSHCDSWWEINRFYRKCSKITNLHRFTTCFKMHAFPGPVWLWQKQKESFFFPPFPHQDCSHASPRLAQLAAQ